jgi:predicted ArsR family transcriptional regulator
MTKHYEMSELKDMTVEELAGIIVELQARQVAKSDGRKEQVLKVLQERGPVSIMDIAELLNISTKNVSSQLTYLRKDGHRIATKSDGRKFIEE